MARSLSCLGTLKDMLVPSAAFVPLGRLSPSLCPVRGSLAFAWHPDRGSFGRRQPCWWVPVLCWCCVVGSPGGVPCGGGVCTWWCVAREGLSCWVGAPGGAFRLSLPGVGSFRFVPGSLRPVERQRCPHRVVIQAVDAVTMRPGGFRL